jgi:hypothetical protein
MVLRAFGVSFTQVIWLSGECTQRQACTWCNGDLTKKIGGALEGEKHPHPHPSVALQPSAPLFIPCMPL